MRRHYATSRVAYGVEFFRCGTTVLQHETLSVQPCVSFTGRVADYATSRCVPCMLLFVFLVSSMDICLDLISCF